MNSLEQWIALRGLLRDVQFVEGTTSGIVTVDPRVHELVDGLADAGLTLRKAGAITPPAALKTGDVVEVSLEGAGLNYYERFQDYLKHFPGGEPQKRFHVQDLGFTCGTGSPPAPFEQYRQAVRLWRLLTELADHVDDRRLFLLSSDKLEMVCAFAPEDLASLEKLSQLEADFSSGSASREEKRTLFARSLLESLRSSAPERRFAVLLKNLAPVYDRYWQNFRLFLEGISFDRIFEGYVEKHAKIITELNSVLGGIQTALIGLPIASFVILEKMTIATHPTFKNTMLMIGCFAFVAFLTILSFSQNRTLDASRALAKELNDEVEGKNPDLAKKLKPSMARLTRHAGWVRALLFMVRAFLLGLVCVTAITYSYVSFPHFRASLDVMLFHEVRNP